MTNNVEPAGSAAVSSPETNGAVAPSCYRVSVISGSLEVSARLKNADDLELLLKVLEANKALFSKEGAAGSVMKATKPAWTDPRPTDLPRQTERPRLRRSWVDWRTAF